MHELLPLLYAWCVKNSLTINENKTKWMAFKNSNNNEDIPVFTLNNVVLECVNTFPYLGLTPDPELKFIDHRKSVVTNIRHKVYQLGCIRNYVDEIVTLEVFRSMVISAFDCVDYVWDRGNIGENWEL